MYMIDLLYKKIWELSGKVDSPESYEELTNLTEALIASYKAMDRLLENPLNPARQRCLSLPVKELTVLLKNSICLVTGGLGCVGSELVRELLRFDIKQIIILDNATEIPAFANNSKVLQVCCDVRDEATLNAIFKKFQPEFVFHTAAQRDPGYAESHFEHAFSVNVLGTLNVVTACEETTSVRQCVFSSTGKASRYYTNEVYAQTKKICEYILDYYARKGRVKYSMTRFTHILDNSLMDREIRGASLNNPFVAVHSPGKYVTAQNVKEAALLLLNCLVYYHNNHCNFLIVRHLEWPVESLEMALFYIHQSGRKIPVIFKGNPPGYCEKFFRGQMNWACPDELNLLINVYEYQHRSFNAEEDIIISHLCPVDAIVMQQVIERLQAEGPQASKEILANELRTIIRDSLRYVDKTDTVKILNWGMREKFLAAENASLDDFKPIVSLLLESLENTEYYQQAEFLFANDALAV